MNDCWNFFRYANNNDLTKISMLFNKNVWLSNSNKNYIKKKISNKECIYESGVVITFRILKEKYHFGTIEIHPNNTLVEKIVRENLSLKNTYAHHVFTKFLNCSIGDVFLNVDADNFRAIKFYNKMNMSIVSDFTSKLDKKKKIVFAFKKNNHIDLN